MPLEEALELGRRLHKVLGLSEEQFEKWAVEEGAKETRARQFTFKAAGSGMELQGEVRRGAGDTFPWAVRLVFTMLPADGSAPSTPPLFKAPGLVSLDPPSGKRYTKEEDLRLFREKKGLSEIIPTVRKETPASTSISNEKTKPAAQQNQDDDGGAFLWLWIGAALTTAAVGYWLVKRSPRQGRV